ncbi:hypothetical protein FIC_01095 [Flavobacteriaceae bacterium 3519-10]|nr:hypothetical protein FIC_01095 [Flavobacteriaceae bacterium 3519-10]
MKMAEKIFHYCTIDTLEKILTNKTIRFSRFDLMDDQTETDGLPEMLKKNYFLSCWVSDRKEKIPQWAMYAPRGVRIELPIKWYKKFPIPVVGTDQFIEKIPVDDDHPGRNTFFPKPFKEWFLASQGFYFVPPLDEEDGFVTKVIYSENFSKLKQQHWKANEDGTSISLAHQAAPIKFKDDYWSFQDEVRFYLTAGCRHEDRHLLPDYIDLPVDEQALKKIKIRLYPNCKSEDWKAVKNLISDKFSTLDSKDIIEKSDLEGKYFPKV